MVMCSQRNGQGGALSLLFSVMMLRLKPTISCVHKDASRLALAQRGGRARRISIVDKASTSESYNQNQAELYCSASSREKDDIHPA